MAKPQTLKGFRDLTGKTEAIRSRVVNVLRNVFEKYGFEQWETPTLEYADVLLGKYGAEADKLVYTFEDRGGRRVGLRYDLTVPFARVLAQYPNLTKPLKRYQIQSTFRAENPQKGRYREFTQCDIDIAGSSSPLADAEILAVVFDSLKSLPFPKFTIRINSRALLTRLLKDAKVPQEKATSVLQSIDKLNKVGRFGVERELAVKRVPPKTVTAIFEAIAKLEPDDNLKEVMELAEKLGVAKEALKFDPTMVRGLDYYTGPIFETVVEKPDIGSVTGGGRYDKLIKGLGGPDIAATGTTIGLDRLVDVIEELRLWPDVSPTPTEVLVTVFSPALLNTSVEIAKELRAAQLRTEIYFDSGDKLDKQFKYADRRGIPFVVVVGPEEQAREVVTVKDLRSRSQFTLLKDKLRESLLSAIEAKAKRG